MSDSNVSLQLQQDTEQRKLQAKARVPLLNRMNAESEYLCTTSFHQGFSSNQNHRSRLDVHPCAYPYRSSAPPLIRHYFFSLLPSWQASGVQQSCQLSLVLISVAGVLDWMLNIHLRSTGERFALQTIHFDSKVRELKTVLEIICGVPAHLQQLTYLDEGILQDSQRLKHYDPVPNCTFELDVWFIYEPIVQAVVANNEAKVMSLIFVERRQESLLRLQYGSSVIYILALSTGCVTGCSVFIGHCRSSVRVGQTSLHSGTRQRGNVYSSTSRAAQYCASSIWAQ